jgi:hypothetical protein
MVSRSGAEAAERKCGWPGQSKSRSGASSARRVHGEATKEVTLDRLQTGNVLSTMVGAAEAVKPNPLSASDDEACTVSDDGLSPVRGNSGAVSLCSVTAWGVSHECRLVISKPFEDIEFGFFPGFHKTVVGFGPSFPLPWFESAWSVGDSMLDNDIKNCFVAAHA